MCLQGNLSFTSLIGFTVRSQFVYCTQTVAGCIVSRVKLPSSILLSRRVTKRWGALESQGGGPERCVRVLFRMFFSVAKQITVQVATQKTVNAPLPTAIQG